MVCSQAERALVDEHVAEATQHIARQKEIIAQFQRAGHPTALAESLLELFEDTLALHLAHRQRLTSANLSCE